jgi:hypothetical protein
MSYDMNTEKLPGKIIDTTSKKLFLAGLVVVILATAYITCFRRITLEPPFPDGVFTLIEENSTIIWYSGLPGVAVSKTLVWRKYYNVGLGDCCYGLQNQEEILAFLDKWLSEKGWIRWQEVGSPCAHLAETDFLERGRDYVPYVRTGVTSLMNSAAVCVAVWPTTPEASNFWVLIATRSK